VLSELPSRLQQLSIDLGGALDQHSTSQLVAALACASCRATLSHLTFNEALDTTGLAALLRDLPSLQHLEAKLAASSGTGMLPLSASSSSSSSTTTTTTPGSSSGCCSTSTHCDAAAGDAAGTSSTTGIMPAPAEAPPTPAAPAPAGQQAQALPPGLTSIVLVSGSAHNDTPMAADLAPIVACTSLRALTLASAVPLHPQHLTQLRSLRALSMPQYECSAAVWRLLARLPYLQQLSLASLVLPDEPAAANITSLQLNGALSVAAPKARAILATALPALQELKLWLDDYSGNHEGECTAAALQGHPHVSKLALSSLSGLSGERCWHEVVRAAGSCRQLQDLRLGLPFASDSALGSGPRAPAFEALASGACSATLAHIDLLHTGPVGLSDVLALLDGRLGALRSLAVDVALLHEPALLLRSADEAADDLDECIARLRAAAPLAVLVSEALRRWPRLASELGVTQYLAQRVGADERKVRAELRVVQRFLSVCERAGTSLQEIAGDWGIDGKVVKEVREQLGVLRAAQQAVQLMPVSYLPVKVQHGSCSVTLRLKSVLVQ
jgi:hypothetical protein